MVWPSHINFVSLYIMGLFTSLFGYYSSTSLKSLSDKELKNVIKICKSYCMNELGVNNRRRSKLKIKLEDNPYNVCYYGEYNPSTNTIHLFVNEMYTLGSFTSTFIHEYTHSLQPITTKYYKLLDEYGYENHPHEIEARDNERIHNRSLLKMIREKL